MSRLECLFESHDIESLVSARLTEPDRSRMTRVGKWVRERFGLPPIERAQRAMHESLISHPHMMEMAVKGDCLTIVEWLREAGVPLGECHFKVAAKHESRAVFAYLWSAMPSVRKFGYEMACRYGVVSVLRTAGFRCAWKIVRTTEIKWCKRPSKELLRWWADNCAYVSQGTWLSAVFEIDDLETARWAETWIRPGAARVLDQSDGPRSLPLTKWAAELGMSSRALFRTVVQNGDMASIRWLVSQGYEPHKDLWQRSLMSDSLEMMDWTLDAVGPPENWAYAMRSRSEEFLDGLRERGMEITGDMIRDTIRWDNGVALRWMARVFGYGNLLLGSEDWPVACSKKAEVANWILDIGLQSHPVGWLHATSARGLELTRKLCESKKFTPENSPNLFGNFSLLERGDILQFLADRGFPFENEEGTLVHVVACGNLALFEFLTSRLQFLPEPGPCTVAALQCGQFHMVRYFVGTLGWRVCSACCSGRLPTVSVAKHRAAAAKALLAWLRALETRHGLLENDPACVIHS